MILKGTAQSADFSVLDFDSLIRLTIRCFDPNLQRERIAVVVTLLLYVAVMVAEGAAVGTLAGNLFALGAAAGRRRVVIGCQSGRALRGIGRGTGHGLFLIRGEQLIFLVVVGPAYPDFLAGKFDAVFLERLLHPGVNLLA